MSRFKEPGIADRGEIQKEKARAQELRKSQWWKQQIGPGICHHCGQKFDPMDLTMDHLIPLSRGGKSNKKNCVPACKSCNSKKSYKTPVDLAFEELERSKK